MGKYLPIIVPVTASLFILIFGYFYLQAGKGINSRENNLEGGNPSFLSDDVAREVPATLPVRDAGIGENSLSSLTKQVEELKSSLLAASSETSGSASLDYRLRLLETAVLELKSRVANPETPRASVASTQYPLYIPLGSGGQSGDQNWISMDNYSVSLNSDDYPQVKGVSLEVNMKLNQVSGTGYARLYNSTDSLALDSEVSTISDKYAWISSESFSLSAGQKTYQLQLRSATGTIISLENARLKISF